MTYKMLNKNCDISVGKFTHIDDSVTFGASCKKVSIGVGCRLHRDLYIDVEELIIGDYCTIHHGSVLHGIRTVIGSNCWIGHYTIIDSLGGKTHIGNNVGVGAHSQLWSHMKFGDTLAGCRWNSAKDLILEDDVWLVGHCIVGSIHAKEKSMLLTGGVATKTMEANAIYAGAPAINISEKMGTQFEEVDMEEKLRRFTHLKNEFAQRFKINSEQFVAVKHFQKHKSQQTTQFNLETRQYLPRYTEDEYQFMRHMLYDKAKFVPVRFA